MKNLRCSVLIQSSIHSFKKVRLLTGIDIEQ